MARKPERQFRGRVRRVVSVLSLGALALSGMASAGPSRDEAKSEGVQRSVESQLSTLPFLSSTNIRKAGVVQLGATGLITEVEPNDTSATAQALDSLPVRLRARLWRAPFSAGVDVDFYSITAGAGDRVFAATMTGASGGSTDTVLDVLASDGTTVIESDDEDGTISGNASAVAGVVLPTAGTYYIRVRQFSITSLTGTIRPYDLYVNLVSGAPQAEVEPNNNGQTPNPLPPNGYMSGVIDPAADNDTFGLAANAGDTIVAILDADPERDAPEWNPRLGIAPFNNFILVANGSSTLDGNPSEALMMTVRAAGNYYIYVDEPSNPPQGGPTFTYHVSVFVIPATVRTGCTTYTGTGGPIADLATTDFTVNVPDMATIEYLKLNFNAQGTTQTAAADFDVTLVSPDGNEVFIVDDLASPATNNAPQFNTTVEDEGAIPIGNFGIANGLNFAPELQGRMEFFKGMQAQGNWILRIRDDVTNAPGTLNSWSLEVCGSTRPACVVPGPNETVVFATDFESGDAGFTHTGTLDEWERGLPASGPITTAHSGVNAWKTDLDSTYENSSNQDLLSPSIDLTTVTTGRVTLHWWQKFQIESASFDPYWVEVRRVGQPATARRVFEWTGATMTRGVGSPAVTVQQSAGWGLHQADISDFAGQNVEVLFHLETDSSVVFPGPAIDDFSVTRCDQVAGQTISNAAVTVTDGQTTYFPGEVLTYTVVASNAGPNALVNSAVSADFPTDLTNVTWTCVATGTGSQCENASGTGDIDESANIAVDGNVTYTVTGTVSATANAPLVVTAGIVVPSGTTDPDTANNTATDTNQLISGQARSIVVDDAGNDVLEPNETVIVAPTWRNNGAAAFAITGTFAAFTGPSGPTYNIPDPQADYGTVAAGADASCTATGNCYSVNITAGARPQTHWDSTVEETIDPTGQNTTWTLHVGQSFTDVTGGPFYRFIETILHRGITGGCTATTYCPTNNTNRDAMSVFVLVAKEGPSYQPPACVQGSERFDDVPFDSIFCRWIEELARRGVVGGCDPDNYCPSNPASREQMSVFVLRTLDPTLDPPACVQGSERFDDVPFDSPFCRWIEELARRGVVSGCTPTSYCPTAPVSREQMSVFLTITFGLTLY